jgi:urease accessory protein
MLGISLPFVEQGIMLSVLLLGVLIAASIRLPLLLGCGMVGLFALWHGYAHVAEMSQPASGIGYALGFMLMTALLHTAGIAFGRGMLHLPVLSKVEGSRERLVQAAGAGIALCGVYLAA